jgi:hypothetical protein
MARSQISKSQIGKSHIPNTARSILIAGHWSLVICLLAMCSLPTASVVAQQAPPDPRFGAVEAFWDAASAAEAGVGWERILFYWSELQPNGPDDWNGYHVPDEWVALAAAQGREVIGLLKYTPEWATDGPPGCSVPRGLGLPVDDPGNLWAAFVRRVVQIYAGRINRWIIWNEPDIAPGTYGAEWCGTVEEYYRLLQVAYLAAHQANPDVTIHLAGLTFYHDSTYLARFLAVATQDPTGPEHGYYFDVVSLHIYFQSETVPSIINTARTTLTSYGLSKPIWVNETNASPDSDPLWPLVRPCWRVSIEEQASFLLQSFALALASGAERVSVYKWLDNDLAPGGEPFGVLRPDGSRRPAFDAYRLLATHYAGTTSAREERQSLHAVVTLDRGGLTTRVLWARTETEATISVPALAARARLIDQTGAEQAVEPVDGQYTLTLPGARCPEEPPDCPVSHPTCIIGGPTYLLVEEASGAPPPAETATPGPTTTPAATTAPADTPTPLPTDTPTPTQSPTPSPTSSPTATHTPTPLPTPTLAPSRTPTPSPTSTPALSSPPLREQPIWPILVGLAFVTFLAAAFGARFKYRGEVTDT